MKDISIMEENKNKSWKDRLPILKSKEDVVKSAKEYTDKVVDQAVSEAVDEVSSMYEDMIGNLKDNYNKTNKYNDRFYESINLQYKDISSEEKKEEVLKEATTVSRGDFSVFSDVNASVKETYSERAELQRISYVRAFKDPIIGSIADTYKRWVLGRGVKFSFQDNRVQKVVEEFWERNDLNSQLKSMYWRYVLESEMFSVLFKDKKNGKCSLRGVNPREITEVETHPEDKQKIFSYKREYVDEEDNYHRKYYPDIDYYDDYRFSSLKKQKSKHEGSSEWTGSDTVMHYIKWMDNREVRSRVFLQRVLKWVEWFNDWVIDRAIINHEKGRVVWILTVRSNKIKNKLGSVVSPPAGGTIKVETPDKKWSPVSANIRADNVKEDGMFLLYQVCTAVSIPLHVLTQRVSEQVYSSIRKAETPFSMSILDRQHSFSEKYLKKVFREVIKTAAESPEYNLPRQIQIDSYLRESLRNDFKNKYKKFRKDSLSYEDFIESVKDLLSMADRELIESDRNTHTKIKYSDKISKIKNKCDSAMVTLIESDFNEDSIKGNINSILSDTYRLFESGVKVQVKAEDCPVKITYPDLVKEDYLEMAKVLEIYDRINLFSRETLREKAGADDPARERHLIKMEQKSINDSNQENSDNSENGDTSQNTSNQNNNKNPNNNVTDNQNNN